MNFQFDTTLQFAEQQDKQDRLNTFRNRFYFADKDTIYLDGNSLGRLPLKTKSIITEVMQKQWGTELIESWNTHWYEKAGELGDKIAGIVGAKPGEVMVSDSTSVNLYKLVHAALQVQKGKTTVVSDVFNFPTDLYILEGILQNFGDHFQLVLANSQDNISTDIADLKEKINKNTALVVLSLVAFKSSFMYNAEKVTQWAHKNGALVLWDLSHAAGAVPVELTQTNADLAVGCTYKYLNGGPGAPAFLYVKKELQEKLGSPIQGWFGDRRPFQFNLNYEPASGIRKFLVGTPPVISLMAIEPGIDLLLEAGMHNLRIKSVLQSEYFLFLRQKKLKHLGFRSGSPADYHYRGSHISLRHPEGYRICQALIQPKNSSPKIIPDFREPDNIRFGITPLYTTFTDIFRTAERLAEITQTKEFEQFSTNRKVVT